MNEIIAEKLEEYIAEEKSPRLLLIVTPDVYIGLKKMMWEGRITDTSLWR